jgi:hypothetical protein
MKKLSVLLVVLFLASVGLVFFDQIHGTLAAWQAPVPVKQPRINLFKNVSDVRRFLQQPQAYPEKHIFVSGIGSGNSDLTTKQAWATAINDNLDARDYAEAGFWSIDLQNASSMPWTGVTVSATFDVTTVQGKIQVGIRVYKNRGNFTGRYVWQTSPGRYTVQTDPFVMEPGHKYEATAYIGCYPENQQASAGIGKVVEIRWGI